MGAGAPNEVKRNPQQHSCGRGYGGAPTAAGPPVPQPITQRVTQIRVKFSGHIYSLRWLLYFRPEFKPMAWGYSSRKSTGDRFGVIFRRKIGGLEIFSRLEARQTQLLTKIPPGQRFYVNL